MDFMLTIIGSAFGSYCSFYFFKKQKIWEERKIIYGKIISAFRDMEVGYDDVRARHYVEPTKDERIDVKKSLSTIRKYSEIENSFLSDDFLSTLRQALRDINDENYHEKEKSFEHETEYDRLNSFTDHAIKVRDIANKARNSLAVIYENDSKWYKKFSKK